MQIAGVTCGICHQDVALESDATWCAACRTVLHRACLASMLQHCPTCRRVYEAPEKHFVFSEVCPVCAAPNPAQLAACSVCRTLTRWDTAAAYGEFRAHMKGVALRYLIRGLGGLAGAGVCVAFMLAVAAPIGWLVGGAMLALTDGIISLLKCRTIGRFR